MGKIKLLFARPIVITDHMTVGDACEVFAQAMAEGRSDGDIMRLMVLVVELNRGRGLACSG